MNVVTHALLPALLSTPLLPRTGRSGFLRAAGAVALGGALPDLVNPHLSLAARYSSWSHTAFALAGLAVVLLAWAIAARGPVVPRVALLAWSASALHLVCDAISGGIVPLYPVADVLLSRRYVPYRLWWWCDAACGLAAIVMLAAMSAHFGKRNATGAAFSAPGTTKETL